MRYVFEKELSYSPGVIKYKFVSLNIVVSVRHLNSLIYFEILKYCVL